MFGTRKRAPSSDPLEKRQRARIIPRNTRVGVSMAAVLLVGVVVVAGSMAAFSATTSNGSNSWTAGTVTLTDDDAGSVMFTVADMAPLDVVSNCIVVTYSGSLLPSDVNLYGISGGTGLDAYLDVTIEEGTGGVFGNCTGFAPISTIFTGTLSSFAATHTNFTNGAGAWLPAANPESRTYKVTVTLQDNNLAQGLNGTATFTWEAQA